MTAFDDLPVPGLTTRLLGVDGRPAQGWLMFDDGRIAATGNGAGPSESIALAPDLVVVAGYVDIHVHGGGGASMTAGEPDAVLAAAAFHRTHGTTTTLASFVTAPIDDLVDASQRIAALIDSGAQAAHGMNVAGIHLEGPFLATGRCGAQNPAHMIDPAPEAVDALIAAGGGHLRMVTIAPERPNAIAAIRRFVDAGVTVAIGHTDADTTQAAAAIAAGATVATHLGNAMAPLGHRAPGPVGACLAAGEVACELIVDGFHLDATFVRVVGAAKGDERVLLITDAISAAGAPDGRYRLGGLDVDVAGGAARLATSDGSTGSLAGSTLTMDAAVRNAAGCGWTLARAVAAATANPARSIGLAGEVGAFVPAARADAVVLDADLAVVAVIVAGRVVSGALVT